MKQGCGLCNSNDLEMLYAPGMAKQPLAGEPDCAPTAADFGIFYPLAKCRSCDAVFSLTEGKDYQRFYSSAKDSAYLSQQDSRNKTFKRVIRDIKNFLPARPRLLDVGCSYGLFLRLARDCGMEAWGVELSEDASRYCRERLGLAVFCSDMQEADLPKDYFDIVTATEVIEHSADPAAFINRTRELLKDGGILYLATPDRRSLSAKIMKSRWWSYRRMHLFYLSRKSIYALLEKNGFSVIKSFPYKKTLALGYIISQAFRSRANKFACRLLLKAGEYLHLDRIMVTASFGDIAVLARKA